MAKYHKERMVLKPITVRRSKPASGDLAQQVKIPTAINKSCKREFRKKNFLNQTKISFVVCVFRVWADLVL